MLTSASRVLRLRLPSVVLFLAAGSVYAQKGGQATPKVVTFTINGQAGAVTPNGIDDDGVVTGSYTDAFGGGHGFVYYRGAAVTVDAPDPMMPLAGLSQVNNRLRAAGNYGDGWSTSLAGTFDIKKREWTTLPSVGDGTFDAASGVNDSGTVVVVSVSTDPSTGMPYMTSFVYRHGAYSPVVVPNDAVPFQIATAINNDGTVVGAYSDITGQLHGFVTHGSKSESVDGPAGVGWVNTAVNGINNHGDIVGTYRLNGRGHGFIRTHDGRYLTFDVANSDPKVETTLNAISDDGNITGYCAVLSQGAVAAFYALDALPTAKK
ncbi:MAG: hypothetical protein WCP29_08485 [Acidobacteriota bacterium]